MAVWSWGCFLILHGYPGNPIYMVFWWGYWLLGFGNENPIPRGRGVHGFHHGFYHVSTQWFLTQWFSSHWLAPRGYGISLASLQLHSGGSFIRIGPFWRSVFVANKQPFCRRRGRLECRRRRVFTPSILSARPEISHPDIFQGRELKSNQWSDEAYWDRWWALGSLSPNSAGVSVESVL